MSGPPNAGPPAPAVMRGDLARVTSRSFHVQILLHPERMQGLGFGYALLPVLRRLVPDRTARSAALTRHLAYFATHPVLCGVVLGVAARLEERRAAGEPLSEESIDAQKRALASPLAALGDPLFWVTLRPLAGLAGILAMMILPRPLPGEPDLRVLLCPLATLLTYNAVALPFRLTGVARGYTEADRPAALLRSLQLPEITTALERAGAFALGALLVLTAAGLDAPALLRGAPLAFQAIALGPLLLGAAAFGLAQRAWRGRPVEAALLALAAALLLAVWI